MNCLIKLSLSMTDRQDFLFTLIKYALVGIELA